MTEATDPRYEIPAVLGQAERHGGRAVLFENVTGYPGAAVVGNVLGDRSRVAEALGTSPTKLTETILERQARGVPPVLVPNPASAPVKEVRVSPVTDLLAIVPVLTYHEDDAAPYITAGVVMAKDPWSGRPGMGIHRLMVKRDRLGIFLASPPLSEFLARAESDGRPLEVAVAVGLDPATLLASVIRESPSGPGKLEIAGALRQAPLELVRAEAVRVEVPAHAELVIEGRILPGVREAEGPFGESTGYYFSNSSPVMQVVAITHRERFIFQGLCPWGSEVDTFVYLVRSMEVLGHLRALCPGVMDLDLVAGSCGLSAVISVRDIPPVEVRRLIGLFLHMDRWAKLVTVVDDDVDIRNAGDVAWAVATRFQPDRDTVVFDGLQGLVIDPSLGGAATVSKLGFDATKGKGREFNRVRIPSAAVERARAILAKSGLGGRTGAET